VIFCVSFTHVGGGGGVSDSIPIPVSCERKKLIILCLEGGEVTKGIYRGRGGGEDLFS